MTIQQSFRTITVSPQTIDNIKNRIASPKITPKKGWIVLKIGWVASELSHHVRWFLRNISLYTEVKLLSNPAKREYLQAILTRYREATKAQKTKILDEFCQVCDYDRKYAINLLTGKSTKTRRQRVGTPRIYSEELLLPHVRFLWFRMRQASAKRMKKAFEDWLPRYRQNEVTPQIKLLLIKMSVSTLDRMLSRLRSQQKASKGLSTTYPARIMQNVIPLQTHDDSVKRPGHTQVDTVSHCGTTTAGQYVSTLTLTDIDSTWTEARALWSKQGRAVKDALKEIEETLPFSIFSLNSDSGSEFLNQEVAQYVWSYKGRSIEFTRSRPYKKNDNCYVEQKNYTHVREAFGYERIESPELIELMNEIYIDYWLPLHNFFLPTFKMKEKIRVGARIKKIYGDPQTPYQRLMSSSQLSALRKKKLQERYEKLDPFTLSEGLSQKFHTFNQAISRAKLGVPYAHGPTQSLSPSQG